MLVGREERIHATMQAAGLGAPEGIEITNARLSDRNKDYTELLYRRLQRKGALYRDCLRMANQDRNVFAACMVAEGDADAMVTGVTRSFSTTLEEILRVLDPRPGHILFGLSVVIAHGRTVLLADTAVHELPTAQELAGIATQAAEMARLLGMSRGWRCSPSPISAIRRWSAWSGSAMRCASSIRARSISNMTARCRPMWRWISS